MNDFWERCAAAGIVIAAVRVYSGYNAEGNLDESKFIGIRFAALHCCNHAVAPEFWFQVEDASAGDILSLTPEEALERALPAAHPEWTVCPRCKNRLALCDCFKNPTE